ncbi:folylpolyglutamate synthase/dihydrofolate synthase family protein [Arcicella sp. LKC2W]|uniref:bifunctional folylpolyglutamate synthase/dihydrofolate synthase n=1 Tax=Arcicella sp. LKC2W TaxID=2984198 RepID=UPI002B1F2A10|nr:folylpolyglutamate synthase/dihydrofolate synthase family protein [Arcicella sp. LKC2W]MEA5458600.1 folylpolyglutamate synthase/dihydrofolate synthase family protein [Arcicella sp. LKC2W]
MTYPETIEYLYQLLPVFHRIGKKAFKANLENTMAICEHLDNPQIKFKSIHIAGTNGKGSSSHFLASILQSAGYKTGLYTSPHLKSFTERIRINGEAISETEVINFVDENKGFIENMKPSFFELTVGMAFDYFAREQVDIAIIEVGLGGRLDSTNVIIPDLSLITNISFDHTDILGDTLTKIATEKAGIIKPFIPVVISEKHFDTELVFINKASHENAPIYFAEDFYEVNKSNIVNGLLELNILDKSKGSTEILYSQLIGSYQLKNIIGVLTAVKILNKNGYLISNDAILQGVSRVIAQTGLKGRWQTLSTNPTIVCDTGHNVSGISEILKNISSLNFEQLWFVLGFVSDKDIDGILELFPKTANYIFCQSNTPRALDAEVLKTKANNFSLSGIVIRDVNEAIKIVKEKAQINDFVYVGGSTFVVSEIENL